MHVIVCSSFDHYEASSGGVSWEVTSGDSHTSPDPTAGDILRRLALVRTLDRWLPVVPFALAGDSLEFICPTM